MNNERQIYPDILRIIACFAVIMIHVSSRSIGELELINTKTWWAANFYFSISRWSVPIFFMVSGMFLLSKTENINLFFKKRVLKIIIPLIIWSVFYKIWANKYCLEDLSVTKILTDFLNGDGYSHLWFLYALVGMYIALPIIRIYIQSADENNIRYFLYLWFFSTCGISFINRLFELDIAFKIPVVSNFIGYFILGYYLNNININKNHRLIIYVIGILNVLITMVATYLININSSNLDQYYYDNLTFTTTLISIAIFVFFKHVNFNNISNTLLRIISLLSFSSFGIYLIHPLIIEIILSRRFSLDYYYSIFPKILGIPLLTLLVFLVSLLAVKILSKIPYLRKIV